MGNSESKKKQKQQKELKEMEEKQKKIGIAVLFLGGQSMQKIPNTQKKIFLRKKGLTEQMVQQAFKRFQEKQKIKKQEKQKQNLKQKTEIDIKKKPQ